jgi:osmotically inducible protein OsmC
MANPIYTARATVTGGRAQGHGHSDDGKLDVQLRLPKEMDPASDAAGTNPEQLFAVGFAACFESALGVIARRQHEEVGEVSIQSSVAVLPVQGGAFKLDVELAVTLPQLEDAEKAKALVAAAHEVCPYSNATRGNIEVRLSANGQPV